MLFNERVEVCGLRWNGKKLEQVKFECTITNEGHGKTLSISDGKTQFSIPFSQIEEHLKDKQIQKILKERDNGRC